ncbi:outer membrane protein assembly factor BamB family protein [Micromonospora sp. BQ11]|uniref:outer membrane protein assembly factor BamB family protein n=1 Tax=Micromonospora sp. BQ11 TaxID=3452212 RepID=UPI003F8CBC56
MAEPLIELGVDRGAPDEAVAPPTRSRRWERGAAVVAGCLLLVGPAAPVPGLTGAAGPAVLVGTSVLSAGEALLVVEPPRLSAYDATAPGGPPRWRVDVGGATGWAAEAAGDLVLVHERDQLRQVVATVAHDARTGVQRWRRPDRVYAAGDGAVAVTEVRSALEPGRRVEGVVHGVDPATGRTRWTAPVPSTAVVSVLPGPPARVLLVHDSGLARVHDVGSGAVRGQGRLPPTDYAPDNPQVVGDRLVLRHPTSAGRVLAGYDLPGFVLRWQRPVGVGEVTARACAGLLCLHQGSVRRAVRPDTGAEVWTWPDGGDWRAVPAGRGAAEPVVLLRPAADGVRRLVAVVRADGPRVIGVLPADARDCRQAAGRLVCRSAERATVWNLPRT